MSQVPTASELVTVAGQPSWRLATSTVEAFVTRQGGMLSPVTFRFGDKKIQPYQIAPWADETVDDSTPSLLKTLRGDFFCMPFGGNDTAYGREKHPPHGETANEPWIFAGTDEAGGSFTLRLSLDTKVRSSHAVKEITLRSGESAVYSRHTVSGMTGAMDFGHHATLQFPLTDGSGRLSTSPFVYAQVNPTQFETAERQGYSALKIDAGFDDLRSVPLAVGGVADLSTYPARKGYEDLVMLVSDPTLSFAWTAVVFADLGVCWYALKNPRVLRNTVLWISNGGRYYAPWNGRHFGVMGLEEVTSYYAYGLAESASPNAISDLGYPTSVEMNPDIPLVVNYIMGMVQIPDGFDRVSTIEALGDGIRFMSESGKSTTTRVDVSFLD